MHSCSTILVALRKIVSANVSLPSRSSPVKHLISASISDRSQGVLIILSHTEIPIGIGQHCCRRLRACLTIREVGPLDVLAGRERSSDHDLGKSFDVDAQGRVVLSRISEGQQPLIGWYWSGSLESWLAELFDCLLHSSIDTVAVLDESFQSTLIGRLPTKGQ